MQSMLNLLLLFCFLQGCQQGLNKEHKKANPDQSKPMKANTERLKTDVRFLTELDPPRNSDNLESLEKAASYIKDEFEKVGLITEEQKWKAEGKEYKNVIASYNMDKKERLVIGAHYDVCGEQAGADDNASAVAGLLEIARLITAAKLKLNYRIDFVAYNLEEPPYFATQHMGSFVHAKYLKQNSIPVIGMLCFEMIGYFSDEPNSQGFPSEELKKLYPSTGNFIIVVGLEKQSEFSQKVFALMKNKAEIDVQLINFPTAVGLAGLSDHRSYWQFDFPAVMINDTSFLRNPNYHKSTDTMETLDFNKMAAVVDATFNAAVNMN